MRCSVSAQDTSIYAERSDNVQAYQAAQSQVAKQFSQASAHYHCHNQLQLMSAQTLLKPIISQGVLLDIGSGPGTDFNQVHQGQVLNLDIAEGMLQTAKQQFSDYKMLCADAQSLPLSDATIDTVYSNLALQWCHSIDSAIQEIHRVLKPKAGCHLAIVCDGSLHELTQLGLKVNPFHSASRLKSQLMALNWQQLQFELMPMQVYFNDLKSLLYSIKGVGASTCVQGEQASTVKLRGRQDWLQLLTKAEQMRTAKGLCLTYNIAIIRGQKR
ncbi:methyltransferase domain-containing protein [Shewanella marina]|uniref:methyltransferase domain-containing protein n=1 Tax=Shewanella marina TaxID=487319 RepID=UPI00047298D1|nr:methyltransferase domain-containing protein [Shewanella marina]